MLALTRSNAGTFPEKHRGTFVARADAQSERDGLSYNTDGVSSRLS